MLKKLTVDLTSFHFCTHGMNGEDVSATSLELELGTGRKIVDLKRQNVKITAAKKSRACLG